MQKIIKSPMNYIGGKYKLLPQILPIFPNNIKTFIDVFTGGANVGINIKAEKIILNDNLIYLMELYNEFKQNNLEDILSYVESKIDSLSLSKENEEGYLALRNEYNKNKKPLDLFILSAFSFNHLIRFNNNHKFNTPFGRDRSSFNDKMKKNLCSFINVLSQKNVILENVSFELLDYSPLDSDDFLYFDPPYLITTGTYNDGKRGFKGWSEKEEKQLLELLDNLNKRKIRFALSNVLEHKNQSNLLLNEWVLKNNYNVYDLNYSYQNSSYNKKSTAKSREVLITNY